MAKNEFDRIFNMSTGHELETELIDTFSEYFYSKNGVVSRSVFRFATKEEDTKMGTDAFIFGLPVDFTCNFAGKNYMAKLSVAVELPGVGRVLFGVRTSNARTEFETPVLVMGVETGSYFSRGGIPKLVDAVRSRIEQIVNVGSDAYWAHCEANGLA